MTEHSKDVVAGLLLLALLGGRLLGAWGLLRLLVPSCAGVGSGVCRGKRA